MDVINPDRIKRQLTMARQKDRQERGSKSVSSKGLKDLVKNGRDYSKPTLNEQLEEAGERRHGSWMNIISVPMGGLNKKK